MRMFLNSLQETNCQQERPTTSAATKLRRRRQLQADPQGDPQPSGIEEDEHLDEEENAGKKPRKDHHAQIVKDEEQNQKAEASDKEKKKNKRKRKPKVPPKESAKGEKKERKKKRPNLRCNVCMMSMRRASIVRHFRRVHNLPSDVKWVRKDHPEVESEVEDNKKYVFDPADMVDFKDPEDPKVILERKIEKQTFKIDLLKEQALDNMKKIERYRIGKTLMQEEAEKLKQEIAQQKQETTQLQQQYVQLKEEIALLKQENEELKQKLKQEGRDLKPTTEDTTTKEEQDSDTKGADQETGTL